MLDWDAFRVVLAIAREGTLIGAARRLGVNQATVGRHLSRAEEALETKLFERRHKGLSPTDGGVFAIEAAKQIEERIHAVHLNVRGQDRAPVGNIRVSIPTNLMPYALTQEIQDFIGQYPDIFVEISATDHQVDFAESEADVVIRVADSPPSSLWGYKIAEVYTSFYASTALYEKLKPAFESGDPSAEIPFVSLRIADPSAERDLFLKQFPNARVCASCSSLDTLIPMVRSGIGVGRIMRFMARYYEDLTPILECDRKWNLSLWVLTHKDFRNTARVRLFIEFINQRFK